LLSLKGPPLRVTGYDCIMPLPRLEHDYIPDSARILEAAHRTLEYQ
jgi:pyruvate dehydrogenase E1 component beta subunit